MGGLGDRGVLEGGGVLGMRKAEVATACYGGRGYSHVGEQVCEQGFSGECGPWQTSNPLLDWMPAFNAANGAVLQLSHQLDAGQCDSTASMHPSPTCIFPNRYDADGIHMIISPAC